MLPQVTITLNMFLPSWLNPGLSFYEQVDGINNFDPTPLVPLVWKVQIHEKPHKQLTYAPHSADVFYLGPTVNHYICYTWYNIDTVGGTTPEKIAFLRSFMKIPNYSSIYMATHAAADLKKSLQTPRPESSF